MARIFDVGIDFGIDANESLGCASEPSSSQRKFLKKVSVTSQREIEKAVRGALDAGRLKGTETLAVNRCRA